MTTFDETYSFESSSRIVVDETPGDNINSTKTATETEQISFTTSPTGTMYTYTVGATAYNLDNRTPPNTAITFTAEATFPEDRYALEYHWDFGDGHEGFGPEVVHEYEIENPHIRAVLRVTDDTGRNHFVGKQLYVIS